MIKLVEEKNGHPWDEKPGYITRIYQSESHTEASKQIEKFIQEGWSPWITSNTGNPGFVIYKEH